MTIYRSRQSAPAPAPGLVADGRAQADYAKALAQAREEGRQLGLKEAADRLAEAQRLAAGIETRLAAQRAELEPVLKALSQSLAEVENLEAQLIQASEAEVVRLAIAIAEKAVRAHIDADPEWMRPVLAEALRAIPDRRQIVIRMHPADAGIARERLAEIAHAVPGAIALEVVDDGGLERGGCILQSLGTTLDAGVAGAVARIGERLLQHAPKPEGWVAVGKAADGKGGQ